MLRQFILTSLIPLLFLTCFSTPTSAAEAPKPEQWEYGTVTGQVRSYYFTQRNKTNGQSFDNIKESLAIGGQLKYESPWIADRFAIGAAGFTTQPFLGSLNEHDQAGTGLLNNKNSGFFALGEAYAKGKYEQTVATMWRQRIETPFINGNDSRMLPQTFEAYTVTSKDIEDVALTLSWVGKEKGRDTNLFKSMTEMAGLEGTHGGVLMAGADATLMDGMPARAWNYYAPDMDNTFFTQLDYTWKQSKDLSYRIKFQGVDQRSVGDQRRGSYNGAEAGLLGGVDVQGFNFDLGGTIVDNSADLRNSWGTYPFFNNLMSYAFNRAGEKALFLGVGYDFSRIGATGFKADIKSAWGDTPDSGRNASFDRDEYTLNLNYAFGEDLKGLSIQNRWSYQDADGSMGGKDGFQVRLRLQYDFSLL